MFIVHFYNLHKIKSSFHHFSASLPSDQSTWSVELSPSLLLGKANRKLISPVVPTTRERLFMPASIELTKPKAFSIVSYSSSQPLTILTLNQAHKFQASQIIGFLDYFLSIISCGKSKMNNLRSKINDEHLSTLRSCTT